MGVIYTPTFLDKIRNFSLKPKRFLFDQTGRPAGQRQILLSSTKDEIKEIEDGIVDKEENVLKKLDIIKGVLNIAAKEVPLTG